MPTGHNLSKTLKQNIYEASSMQDPFLDSTGVMDLIFPFGTDEITPSYLTRQLNWMRRSSTSIDDIREYIEGKSHSGGEKRKLADLDDEVAHIATSEPHISVQKIADRIEEQEDVLVSSRTIQRSLDIGGVTLQTFFRESALRDQDLCDAHLDMMAHVHQELRRNRCGLQKIQTKKRKRFEGKPSNNERIYNQWNYNVCICIIWHRRI